MARNSSQIILAVIVVVLLCIVAFSIVYDSKDVEHETEVDIEGYWYLVDSESFDGNSRLYNTINHNFDMDIDGFDGTSFFGSTRNYAVTDDIPIAGYYDGKNFICEYQTEYGYVQSLGYTYDGNIYTKETHYYDTISDSQWFVAMNVYSKDPNSDSQVIHTTPELYFGWTAWEGYSMNLDGTYDLDGTLFRITKQSGDFIRAEMEQTVMGMVVTKILNGVVINHNTMNGVDGYTVYLMDSTGINWNMYMTSDVLVLRTNTLSELTEIVGEAVTVERIYRNMSVLGIPIMPDAPTEIIGNWVVKGSTWINGEGTVLHDVINGNLEFTKQKDALYAGSMNEVMGSVTRVGEIVAYSVANDRYAGNNLIHTLIEDQSGNISYGYAWITGDKMIFITFWSNNDDHMNGVTTIELQRE